MFKTYDATPALINEDIKDFPAWETIILFHAIIKAFHVKNFAPAAPAKFLYPPAAIFVSTLS